MTPLNQSVAGIRGIWGENLTPAVGVAFSAAFGTYLKGGKVLIGRDTRISGEILTRAAIVGLASAGCKVTDIGVVPTPTCQLAVEKTDAAGGMVITASHNPGEWNGLKFLNRRGHFLNQVEYDAFISIYNENRMVYAKKPELKFTGKDSNKMAIALHLKELMKHAKTKEIRKRKFRVVLDAVNGAGSRLLIPLLEHLGCTVIPLYCDESGEFPRGAEPMPENLKALCRMVRKEKADIGFAVDPDADRLSLVSEKGEALGEEMTLPLAARYVLSMESKGVIVTNLSTSMTIDHVAREFGRKVIRTRIGEAHVVSGMKAGVCIIGGEGNGGVILPSLHYARDTGAGIVLILNSLAITGKTLSGLASALPRYVMVKKKMNVPLEKIPSILEAVEKKFRDAEINTIDGVKLVWADRWLHVRKSGTEGALRIFTEALSRSEAERLADEAIGLIQTV